MQTVVEGRWLQEQRLWSTYEAENSDAVRPPGLMTRSEVEDYVALFERYTRHMLETLPGQADVLLSRGEGFTYTLDRIRVRAHRRASAAGTHGDPSPSGWTSIHETV